MDGRTESRRRLAAGAIAATGVLHLVLAPEYMGEQAYVGVLFILGAIAAIAVAIRLWSHDDGGAWALGSLIAGGMAVGFVLSRRVGLPGFHESEWELSGLVSLVLEGGFLALAASALRRPQALAA